MPDRENGPQAYLRSVDKEGQEADAVVCLGDSITRGNMSADWVGILRSRLGSLGKVGAVVNAGTNMHCARNVCRRLDEILSCRPSHVVVLIGTNDLKAELSTFEGLSYCVLNGLARVPSLEAYEQDLSEVRDRLLASGARVAFASPPVLGEDAKSEANSRAAAYAAAVQRVAAAGGPCCTYLPLHERTRELLPKTAGKPYNGWRFWLWMSAMCWDVYVLQKDYLDVQRERNLGVTVDLVHLGPEAATSLAEMAADFVCAEPEAEAG